MVEQRFAFCRDCGTKRESNPSLPLFKDQGPGSYFASRMCVRCGYSDIAHHKGKRSENCSFLAGYTKPSDSFYCGCKGWD